MDWMNRNFYQRRATISWAIVNMPWQCTFLIKFSMLLCPCEEIDVVRFNLAPGIGGPVGSDRDWWVNMSENDGSECFLSGGKGGGIPLVPKGTLVRFVITFDPNTTELSMNPLPVEFVVLVSGATKPGGTGGWRCWWYEEFTTSVIAGETWCTATFAVVMYAGGDATVESSPDEISRTSGKLAKDDSKGCTILCSWSTLNSCKKRICKMCSSSIVEHNSSLSEVIVCFQFPLRALLQYYSACRIYVLYPLEVHRTFSAHSIHGNKVI